MFILFAFLAQAAAIPADTKMASLTCSQAAALAPSADSDLRRTAQVSYFAMVAAKADPGTAPFFDRLNELMDEMDKMPAGTPEEAAALLKQCDQRFPVGRSTLPAKLPQNPFERDVVCFGALSLMQGAAEQMAENGGDPAPKKRIEAALAPLSERITDDELQKRGLTDGDGFTRYLGEQLKASLPLGNAEAIAMSCGVTKL